MNNDRSYAVPKPSTSKAKTKVKGHLSGPTDQLTAIYNAILTSPDCKDVHYVPAMRGETEENSWTLTVEMNPTKRRKEKPEQPIVDLRGYAYCVEGLSTGRIKFGGTNDMDRRLGELEREFREPFRRLHVVHCENWKRTEKLVHDYLTAHGLHVDREFYTMPEWAFDWFISLPNE